jgi:hypothetical protein
MVVIFWAVTLVWLITGISERNILAASSEFRSIPSNLFLAGLGFDLEDGGTVVL